MGQGKAWWCQVCQAAGVPGCRNLERPHLVADEELALPQGAGHVVDGQAQVVVTIFQVQDSRLLDQLSPQLLLQLHHLLQCPRWSAGLGAGRASSHS